MPRMFRTSTRNRSVHGETVTARPHQRLDHVVYLRRPSEAYRDGVLAYVKERVDQRRAHFGDGQTRRSTWVVR